MSEEALSKESKGDLQWYEDEIPVRGCELSLPQIKAAYRELATLTKKEGETIVSKLVKPDDLSDEDFKKQNEFLRDDAFRITVSIIGFDGETAYSETEEIFDSKNLPHPIKTIFFTNSNSFKRNASGNLPRNRFNVFLHFDKPPLIDPNPLVSEPTINYSKVEIHAEYVVYFRAVQTIVNGKLRSKRKFFSFIHEKFTYDVGLWFIAIPYSLYWVTVFNDYFFPAEGKFSTFRVAFFIYGCGMSLFIYRALFMYLKWAFPVNILEENKDRAMRHRIVIGAIITSLIVSGIKSVLGKLAGM